MKRRVKFITWAKKDIKDTRKINYTFYADEKILRFTSDDTVTFSMMERIRNAWIKNIELKNNEWYATLYEE